MVNHQEERQQEDTDTDRGQAKGQQRVSLIGRYQNLLSESTDLVPAWPDKTANQILTQPSERPKNSKSADVRVSIETLVAGLDELTAKLDAIAESATAASDKLRARIDALERARSSTKALLLKLCIVTILLSGVSWAYGAGWLERAQRLTVPLLPRAAEDLEAVYDGAGTRPSHPSDQQSAAEVPKSPDAKAARTLQSSGADRGSAAKPSPGSDPHVQGSSPDLAVTTLAPTDIGPTARIPVEAGASAVSAHEISTPPAQEPLPPQKISANAKDGSEPVSAAAISSQLSPDASRSLPPAAPEQPSPPAAVSSTTANVLAIPGRIVIRAKADTWVQVHERSGKVLLERILRSGEEWSPPTKLPVLLTTGNAGATEVLVDGVTVPQLGGSGVVRHDIPLDPDILRSAKPVTPISTR